MEMDLTLAKSQGYLKNQLRQSGSSSEPSRKLLAVIGVHTGFGSQLRRNAFRGSWMPKGQSSFRYYLIGAVNQLAELHLKQLFFFVLWHLTLPVIPNL